ncbi:MAG TPA: LuxR C-terminal-related transcriptional regulator [Solirubrobacteraceae bacterium]|nr:LuxR C-terminal-related transcriptional regulator [Solirubrobacteraceae bacterium]
MAGSDSLRSGFAALDAGRYQQARAAFEKALAVEASAAGYDGLAQALRWLGDGAGSLAARELAHRSYREAGDAARAGLTAGWLAWDTLVLRGDWAVAQGWFALAERLLTDAPRSVERGYLLCLRALVALNTFADARAAEQQAHEAAELGSEHDEADLEFGARSVRGLARVALGDVPGGMRDLDEASAAAVAGEVRSPMTAALVWCNVIYACERVHDIERAAQWCAIVREQAERIQSRQTFGFCRSHYARVLITRGEWREAEAELELAQSDFSAAAPAGVYEAALALAELRRRQGRFDEAISLCASCEWHEGAQLCLAEIAWDRADTARARELFERRQRRLSAEVQASDALGLELAVCLAVAERDAMRATEWRQALSTLATAADTPALLGRARFAAGVAATLTDRETARVALEDAVDAFTRASMPFESARARVALARLFEASDRSEAAALWKGASAAFAGLGLRRDPRELDRPLASIVCAPRGELTARERQVLRLIVDGLSDEAIAERLVLSPHTVHRHVANIRTKLRQPSRAAAAARAIRDGLI